MRLENSQFIGYAVSIGVVKVEHIAVALSILSQPATVSLQFSDGDDVTQRKSGVAEHRSQIFRETEFREAGDEIGTGLC